MKQTIERHLAEALGIDDPEIQEALYTEYCGSVGEILKQIGDAVEAKDCEALVKLGHKLKGCAATIGHEEARRSAALVEDAARRNDLETCRGGFSELLACYSGTIPLE